AIVETIEARGTAVTDALAAKIERVTEVLRNDTAQIERSLGSLAEEVSRALLERTKEITLARESLRSDVSGVLKQLEQANIQLQVVLEGVSGNLGTMEGTLAERLTALQSSIEGTVNTTRTVIDWAGGQVTDLREISSGVLRDLSTLTLRFENQGKFIAGIAEALGETHGRIDQTLADRRTAIEEIVALLGRLSGDLEGKLAGRANELGERLAAFNQLLQEALGQAETRARETANLVAETTTSATQAITNQYELIRGAYSEERGRTAIALKSTYQEAVEEMGGLFHEMNERFAVAARELRDMAEEVQRSLELTREELKRGVLELPEETRESAAAMRRVVADQIKALSELNDIVARHGRRVDLSEARRISPPTNYRGGGGGGEEAAPPSRAPREQQAPVAELPRPAPRTAPREQEEEFAAGVAVAAEPRRATAREGREQNGERSGWLGDLLSRASDRDGEGQRRTPLQTIESLDSLSSDVARMIDHDAAVELWDRYKRGERNVVGRRLYTAHGQKTFDEIRRRYRRSAEFRDTVDRYIEEFERLLDQVARDDRGQGLTRTYLTSDTGKVYTLLAHAAGRLE
ncbi:MAG TPA: apolipoprotein acyltransferase, partial [Xanthobacteraceae bacterium]|nr:apolipoprotein acyltransferase [Xanthobacteraceae bacterium]